MILAFLLFSLIALKWYPVTFSPSSTCCTLDLNIILCASSSRIFSISSVASLSFSFRPIVSVSLVLLANLQLHSPICVCSLAFSAPVCAPLSFEYFLLATPMEYFINSHLHLLFERSLRSILLTSFLRNSIYLISLSKVSLCLQIPLLATGSFFALTEKERAQWSVFTSLVVPISLHWLNK